MILKGARGGQPAKTARRNFTKVCDPLKLVHDEVSRRWAWRRMRGGEGEEARSASRRQKGRKRRRQTALRNSAVAPLNRQLPGSPALKRIAHVIELHDWSARSSSQPHARRTHYPVTVLRYVHENFAIMCIHTVAGRQAYEACGLLGRRCLANKLTILSVSAQFNTRAQPCHG